MKRIVIDYDNPITVVTRRGEVVFAKLYMGAPSAVTFANRTQAYTAAGRLGSDWEVIQRGRPWLVRRKPETLLLH